MPRRLNRRLQLMSRLILNPRKNINQLRTPDLGIILSAPGLPQNDALVWVIDEYAVHGEFAALVDEGLAFGGFERCVAAADDEALVAFEPADFEEVGFCAGGTDVGDVVGDGAGVEGALDA